MKRFLVLLTVVTMLLAMAAASPVFANGQSTTTPNCEDGQFTAAFKQTHNGSSHDNSEKHLDKLWEGCVYKLTPPSS